ncbi:MAG: hypothetical protein LBC27_03540, partial [Spirochaetaceae bacterium]|nr:hypothetical protein [Spirochaetaceae bacterium]
MRNIKNLSCFCALLMVCALFFACPTKEDEPDTPDLGPLYQEAVDNLIKNLGTNIAQNYTINADGNINFVISGGKYYDGTSYKLRFNATAPLSSGINIDFSVANMTSSGNSSVTIPTTYLVGTLTDASSYDISVTVKAVADYDGKTYTSGPKTLNISAASLSLVSGTVAAFKVIRNALLGPTGVGGTLAAGTITYEAGSVGTLYVNNDNIVSLAAITGTPAVLLYDSGNPGDVKAIGVGTAETFAYAGSFTLGSISLPGTLAIKDAGSAGANQSNSSAGTFVVTFGGGNLILGSGNVKYTLGGTFSSW